MALYFYVVFDFFYNWHDLVKSAFCSLFKFSFPFIEKCFVKYSYYNNSDFFPVTRLSAETFGSVLPQMPMHCYE